MTNGESTMERDVKSLPDGAVGSGRGCGVRAAAAASRERCQSSGYEGAHYYCADVSERPQACLPFQFGRDSACFSSRVNANYMFT